MNASIDNKLNLSGIVELDQFEIEFVSGGIFIALGVAALIVTVAGVAFAVHEQGRQTGAREAAQQCPVPKPQ